MTIQPESLEFKAEVQQLLNILSHSLYTEREIFLRELISNASDALNRVQFEMLTNHDLLDPEVELAVRIDFDEQAKTITVSDTGIGMTREELIENLGTIAHSGAMAFIKKLEAEKRLGDIIGQFGVGFYSVFMVAEKVSVTSRSYLPDAPAWTWASRGDNTYTLTPAEKTDRGTTIEIELKEDAVEFASAWKLEQIVKKHSNYVSFPIYVKDKVVNQQTALWRKPPNEVTDDEHAEFYRQLTLDFDKPLLHMHIVTDAPVDIRSVLYVPRSREQGIFRLRTDHGLKLYSRKILIQENNKEMLPEYLRFIEGVVDSADIPLNVARESVQSTRTIGHIKKALRGRVLKTLKELGDEKPDDYKIFWEAFGPFIKEGVASDYGGRDDLLPLLRFPTSKSNGGLVALSEYVARMVEGQTDIYYILGDDLNSVARSPHLDAFKLRNLEVLYLVDPLDAFMVQGLREYEGKPLKNVDDPNLQLPGEPAPPEAITADALSPEVFGRLIVRFKSVLGARVSDVRESKVLKDSPCRLVSPDSGPEREMQRVRRLIEQDYQTPVKIIEINRGHPLIQNLAHLAETQFANPLIDATIEQLFENLLLLEGLHPNPAQMVPRIQDVLERAVATSAGK
ncbi:MAG TPA: molecular chaperone HtpG [Anaerolineae bacterium]|nr:molecular chaperone HtpG [Anaerolineae bacterium]HQI84386.1 molecular chaperone HtpG [Anaerolineae bacterium]